MDNKLAKEMIRKGIEHNDPELIELGNKILSQFFPDNEVLEKEPITISDKKKRGRPKKSKTTTVQTEKIVNEQREPEDFTAPPRFQNHNDGSSEGKRMTKRRSVQINIKPITLDEHKEDSKIDAILVNSNYKPKYREKFSGYDLVCNTCEKSFKSDIFRSTCEKCLRGKIR